ncbi:rhomboid family intramembrane serine protease GlpG [Enterobacter cloacae complex sp. P24RS]|uniref:rhomboid family intramembrane serine protease GlpG n=1 Tax=Enterobacter cloacae complex sp. P24RS TaxID=2779568 RepID=UPI0018751E8D|nr:rhomboid family intramembrane serine protease GlpG [Enterobacter cloacae complex sp. P24RS]MBE4963252.1 rhomboid family intramembrane serine protease GlpG [Enterobacter cloacae complex sp. P24RS]MBM7016437.1 rhomboid family intramembrane serine protease GlpG [Enterobacter cloacae]
MLMITSFSNPRVAQAFVDYMATQGIILTIQQHTQTDVWLADESQAERVNAELARFLENPGDPRYLAASWQSGQTGSGLHYQRFPFLATLRERSGPFTLLLMAACIIVFIIMNVVGDQSVMIALAWPYDPSLQFDVWRYFTHALMHFSVMHILFNLLWWWYLGGAVEKRLGSGKLIVITVISALLSGYVQHKFSGPWFGGLSGVVYALMGYAWLRGERDPESGIYLQRGLITFALIWLIAGWFDLFGMSIANGAHVTGLAVGLAMALADTLHARKRT